MFSTRIKMGHGTLNGIFIKAALSTTNSQIRTPIFYSEVLVYVRELFKIMLMMQ